MSTHTPGPWQARFSPKSDLVAHWDIYSNDGENLACLPEETQEPDARLIAAAPDLLAALELVSGQHAFLPSLRETIDNAIAKARGEA
jgi:hypothetical protein